jgi:hypothetical protein
MHFLNDVILPEAMRLAWLALTDEQREAYPTQTVKSLKTKIPKKIIKDWASRT